MFSWHCGMPKFSLVGMVTLDHCTMDYSHLRIKAIVYNMTQGLALCCDATGSAYKRIWMVMQCRNRMIWTATQRTCRNRKVSIPALRRCPNHFICTSGRNAAQILASYYKPAFTHIQLEKRPSQCCLPEKHTGITQPYVRSWREFKMADTLQWSWLHLDYLRHIEVSWCDACLELCTDVSAYRKACRLARISCHVERGPKWHLRIKALVGVSPDSFVVSKYITIWTGASALTAAFINCRPHISFIDPFFLLAQFFLSKPSAVTNEWIACFFTIMMHYAEVVHLYLHFLYKVTISKYLLHWDFYIGYSWRLPF